jgi:PilZ domain
LNQGGDRWDNYIDSLKLNDHQLMELLASRHRPPVGQKEARGTVAGESKREYRRVRIRGALWVPAEIQEPSGTTHRIKVYPVDIATGGMCFFTDRFMHHGTLCDLTFHLPDGEAVLVTGKAVRCSHLQGRIHEVGVEFNSAFDMGLLRHELPAASISPAGETAGAPSGTPPSAYAGSEGQAQAGVSGYSGAAPVQSASTSAGHSGDSGGGGVSEDLRQRLPKIAIELKVLAERMQEIHVCSTRLNEIGRELHVGSNAG